MQKSGSHRSVSDSDILSIVEAAYAVDAPAHEWSLKMLSAAELAVGEGMGGFICALRVETDGRLAFDVSSAASIGVPEEMLAAIFQGLTQTPPGWLSSHLAQPKGAAICLLTSEADPQAKLEYRAQLADSGVRDGINVVSIDLDGSGLLLSLGTRRGGDFTEGMRKNLRRVATHILAAQRLRSRLRDALPSAPASASLDSADAVLSPDGNLLHATGRAKLADARTALKTAVRDVEQARRSLRSEPEEALDLWKGLVFAHWTLVDQFDRDGTKYVVARENQPHSSGLQKLTPTERCVVNYAARGFTTNEVAYTLGISPATVRVLLMRAARRCGVATRQELLDLSRSTPHAHDTGGEGADPKIVRSKEA